jgi:tetratricopeptide (TPR) repeat protein
MTGTMKTRSLFCFLLCLAASTLWAQYRSPQVVLKVAEKSGWLGMGKPRYVKIVLTTKNRDSLLTSDNVNGTDYYYFAVRNTGDWKLDDSFVMEKLPQLSLSQNGQPFPIEFRGPVIAEKDSTVILTGFSVKLKLYQPFTFVYKLGESQSTAEMTIAQECWPGYTKITSLLATADAALAEKKYLSAVENYDAVLRDKSLQIFAIFANVKPKRLHVFELRLKEASENCVAALTSPSDDLKQKIAAMNDFRPQFKQIRDNLADASLGIQESDSGVTTLLATGSDMVRKGEFWFDSLNRALDEQNTRWIIAGSSSGKIDYKYKYIIESLAWAFTSVNFQDTSAPALALTLPEAQTARLQKYQLFDSYETFVRIVSNRWKARQPLFPREFFVNLQKDSAQFALPYYSMLKAVSEYFSGNLAAAREEITQVMRLSFDFDLVERMDHLRILINTREKKISPEVLQHMKMGAAAEEKGEKESAISHYKDALVIAEEFAPAAFALGKLLDADNQSYIANNYFKIAITADSLYFSAYKFLFTNNQRQANYKPMVDLLAQAVSRGNDFYAIRFYLGAAYNGVGLYNEAIAQFERALELNPKSIEANIQAGISYLNIKSYPKAREYFNRALAIDPENIGATEQLKGLDELQKSYR